MASTLLLEFSRDAIAEEYINFTLFDLDSVASDVVVSETWKDGPRVQLKTVETVLTVPPWILPAGKTKQYYKQALNLDYGSGLFLMYGTDNRVEISSNDANGIRWGFKDLEISAVDLITNSVITNDEPNPMYVISEVIQPSSIPCIDYEYVVRTSLLATEITLNGFTVTNDQNPRTLQLSRSINNTLSFKDVDGNEAISSLNPIFYGTIYEGNTTIDIQTNISGATATISTVNSQNLELQYKIGNGSWQTSNVFSGLIPGDYILDVKDQLGCEISKGFTVTTEGTKEPFTFISKANSLNFILQEDTSSCDTPRNDDNTFAYQNISKLPSCTETLLQTCDKTTTQLKSNFDDVTAKIISESGVETEISVVKKSDNINRFESMDCTMYEYGENKAGIYFTEGKTYEPGWVYENNDYALNGNLPDFAILGNVIEIENLGTFEITSILFDDRSSVRKKVMVIDYNYTGIESPQKIACYFDLLPYEIYQFEIDWSLFAVGYYEVRIKNEDTINGIKEYVSENVNLAIEHLNTLRIDYYNSNNRDIFYKYDIEHRIRIPFISIQAVPNGEEEISLTDDGAYVVDSNIYESDKITFDSMVKSLMRKVSIALGCKYVFVNGVGYVGDGGIDFEPIGQTNLYDVSKTMIKSNVSYNTRNVGNSGVSDDYISFNIPALISYGAGLIKR